MAPWEERVSSGSFSALLGVRVCASTAVAGIVVAMVAVVVAAARSHLRNKLAPLCAGHCDGLVTTPPGGERQARRLLHAVFAPRATHTPTGRRHAGLLCHMPITCHSAHDVDA